MTKEFLMGSIKLASALILISLSGLGLAASFTVLPRMRHETGEISAQCSGLSAVAGRGVAHSGNSVRRNCTTCCHRSELRTGLGQLYSYRRIISP